MKNNKKKCIICGINISEQNLVKKYNSQFCSKKCLEEYEIILTDAKKKKLGNCC